MGKVADFFSRLFPVPEEKATAPSLGALIANRTSVTSSPRMNQSNMDSYLGRYADSPWIYSCIRVIQSKGAGVPLKVYRRVGENLDWIPDHPLQKLLDSVNDQMNGYDLREATHGHIELAGNAYWFLDAFVKNKPSEIYPINPMQIKIIPDKQKLVAGYEQVIDGKVIQTFQPEEIIHFKTWNPLDYLYGLAPICAARDASDMMLYADQYNKGFFANGAEPGGFLTSDNSLDENAVARIKSMWKKQHQGTRNAHRVAILDGGLKFTESSRTHTDMQFAELKKMTREDVLTVFNMPPIMVGVFDEANYSNAREQRRIFWIDCMIPRLRKIESVINERLVKPFDSSVIVQHDLAGIEDIAEDTVRRAQADNLSITNGSVTINEVRKVRNLLPVSWGETWWKPFGMESVDAPTQASDTPGAGGDVPTKPTPDAPAKSIKENNDTTLPPAMSPPVVDQNKVRRDQVWLRFKGLLDKQERKWAPVMRMLFTGQEREVISNLESSNWQKTVNQNRLDKFLKVKASIDAILFDGGQARMHFRKDASSLMLATIKASAQKEVDDYGLGIDFNLSDPNVVAWVHTKSFKFANEVNTSTEDALRRNLEEALRNGETIQEVEQRIAEVFDIARGSRTATIARTEVISASNQGAVESYKQSGVVDDIEWVSTRDNLVRDSHQIDGEQVKIGMEFSNGLHYPGDPAGEPGEVINCRCTVAPVVNDKESAAPIPEKKEQVVQINLPPTAPQPRIIGVEKEIVRDADGKITGVKEVNVYEGEK